MSGCRRATGLFCPVTRHCIFGCLLPCSGFFPDSPNCRVIQHVLPLYLKDEIAALLQSFQVTFDDRMFRCGLRVVLLQESDDRTRSRRIDFFKNADVPFSKRL